MATSYEWRRLPAALIFDLEDTYAGQRRVRGNHPQPIGPIHFRVVGRIVGGSHQDFERPLELCTKRNASGYYLFFGHLRARDAMYGQSRLPDGTYVMRLASDFYQWVEQEIDWPPLETPSLVEPLSNLYSIALAPGYAYPFSYTYPLSTEGVSPAECTAGNLPPGRGPTLLRGSLHSTDGRGIARATIQVVGQPHTYWTNDTGQWVLWFPDDHPTGPVTVRFELPDGTVAHVAGVCVVRGHETSLAPTAVRGAVQTDAGVSLSGATLQVLGYPGSATSDSNGRYSYYFGLNQTEDTVSIMAVLPDGRSLTLSGVQVRPRATVVVPTFRFS